MLECVARGGELSVELDSVVVGVLVLEFSEMFVLVYHTPMSQSECYVYVIRCWGPCFKPNFISTL